MADCELRIANQVAYCSDEGDQEEKSQREAEENEEIVQMIAQPGPVIPVQAQVVGH